MTTTKLSLCPLCSTSEPVVQPPDRDRLTPAETTIVILRAAALVAGHVKLGHLKTGAVIFRAPDHVDLIVEAGEGFDAAGLLGPSDDGVDLVALADGFMQATVTQADSGESA